MIHGKSGLYYGRNKGKVQMEIDNFLCNKRDYREKKENSLIIIHWKYLIYERQTQCHKKENSLLVIHGKYLIYKRQTVS